MKTSKAYYTGLEDMSVKGGSDIGVVAAQALQAYAMENLEAGGQFYRLVDDYGQKLKALKPSMASVHNIVDQMIQLIHEHDLKTPTGQEAIDALVANYKTETEAGIKEIARIFANTIEDGDVIHTHSFTKTALMGLEQAQAAGKKFSVVCNESRPLREGAYLATLLAGKGIQASVITDAAMAYYLPGCTKVVVGADALYTDGTVVNKMGTLAISMLAKALQKPVYVLTITSKLYWPSLQGHRLKLERRPAKEVMEPVKDETAAKNLTVENIFFEETPGEFSTYLVTEKGLIKPYQLMEICK